MQALAYHYISEEEYLELEEESLEKHEYFDGEIFAMAGGTAEHNVLGANVIVSLGSQLRGKPCRVATSDQRVKVSAEGLYTYPDAVVYCPPFQFDSIKKTTLLNPVVIIEVLSASTADYDKGKKFDSYKKIESLRDYVLISQDEMRVEHFHRNERDEWIHDAQSTASSAITLASIDCVLPLADVYDGIEVPTNSLRAPFSDEDDFGSATSSDI